MPLFVEDDDERADDDYLICLECNTGILSRSVSYSQINDQLDYFKYMFDLQNHDLKSEFTSILNLKYFFYKIFLFLDFKMIPEVKKTYSLLLSTVEKFINNSGYFYLNFSKMYENYAVQETEIEAETKTLNLTKTTQISQQTINWAKYLKSC